MSNSYLAARCDGAVYVRVEGLANMKNAPLLRDFLDQELSEKVSLVFIDLSACRGMDSTFMGTLVGYASRFEEINGNLAVLNPSEQNRRLLDMLGVSEVLPVIGDHEVPDLRFSKLDGDEAISVLARAEMMRQAHEELAQLSEANRDKFAPFLKVLQEDVKRLTSDS